MYLIVFLNFRNVKAVVSIMVEENKSTTSLKTYNHLKVAVKFSHSHKRTLA